MSEHVDNGTAVEVYHGVLTLLARGRLALYTVGPNFVASDEDGRRAESLTLQGAIAQMVQRPSVAEQLAALRKEWERGAEHTWAIKGEDKERVIVVIALYAEPPRVELLRYFHTGEGWTVSKDATNSKFIDTMHVLARILAPSRMT